MKVALTLNGYFSSRSDTGSIKVGELASSYIKKSIIDKVDGDVDVFIHSWDLQNKDLVLDLYQNNVRKYVFEEQKDFSDELLKVDEEWLLSDSTPPPNGEPREMYENCRLNIFFSYLYSRKEAILLKKKYEEENNFKYDCVFVGRFDLGFRGKEHYQPFYPTDVYFDPQSDMKKIWTPFWLQFNAGFADHWWYSNSENIDIISTWYDRSFEYFQKDSPYVRSMTTGWFDSNREDIFSNEVFKQPDRREKNLMTHPRYMSISTHHNSKWFLKDVGLYSSVACHAPKGIYDVD